MSKTRFQILAAAVSFALVGAASVGVSRSALAVRFQSEDDGSGMRTKYPGAEVTLVGRSEEVLANARSVPLGALVPQLSQFASVIGGQRGAPLKSPRERAIAYLDHAADLLVAQSPEELQLKLRRAYFEGEGVTSSESLWRTSAGARLAEGRYFGGQNFSIEVANQLAETPILQKLHRLLALVEISQTAEIMKRNPDMPYRHLVPVIQQVNQIATLLLTEELLSKIDSRVLTREIEETSVRDSLRVDLELDRFLDRRVSELLAFNADLKQAGFVEWFETLRDLREEKARALGNGSELFEELSVRLRGKLGAEDPAKLFRIAGEARANGDERLSAVARELIRRPLSCEMGFL